MKETGPTAGVLFQLLQAMPLGIVVLDAAGLVVLYNECESRLAGRASSAVVGKSFFGEVAPCLDVRDLGGEFAARIGRGRFHVCKDVTLPFPQLAQPRDVLVCLTSFEADSEHYGCVLIQDTSERLSLARARETLGQLMVHDLKNPLNAVLLNLGLALREPDVASNDRLRTALQRCESASSRMQKMIGTLLDITLLQTQTFPLRREWIDLDALVRQVVADEIPLAEDRGLQILIGPPTATLLVFGDIQVLTRALENLIDNALCYTPRGGQIAVRAMAVSDTEVAIEVENQGATILADQREQIFRAFTRSEGAPSVGSGHQGLGLTMVKLAANAHGGEVSLETPRGGGTLFRITLPRDLGRS